jgi:hypothetical protein
MGESGHARAGIMCERCGYPARSELQKSVAEADGLPAINGSARLVYSLLN